MPVLDLPYAYGKPPLSGDLRSQPADFIVEEQLGFEPEGEGEHHFLWLQKTGLNTEQVARTVARFAGVPPRQVSYSGMKDRHAITRQWLSVHLPGNREYPWSELNSKSLSILTATRHRKKLRRGTHQSNQFTLRVRNLVGDRDELAERVSKARQQGVPNYFGEQRFGRNGSNVEEARRWFDGQWRPKKHQRGIYLSAARSFLFNEVLAQRVRDHSWQQLLPGEVIALNGSHSVFTHTGEASLTRRLAEGDIHPSGPMAGKKSAVSCENVVASLEASILNAHVELLAGLEQAGLKAERRPLRVIPENLLCKQLPDQSVELTFSLPSGCFATALMRELIHYRVIDSRQIVD